MVQEYLSNALRKKELGLSTRNVQAFLDSLDDITVIPVADRRSVRFRTLRVPADPVGPTR